MKIVIASWHLKDFNVSVGRYWQDLESFMTQSQIEEAHKLARECKPKPSQLASHLRGWGSGGQIKGN